jgi:death-on-curing protein
MQIYLPIEEIVIELHDAIIDVSGGRKGILKAGAINAAVHRPKTYLAYQDSCDIHTVCAVLLDSISRNHAFADGNKRTGLMTVILTYELNGIALKQSADRTTEFEDLVLWVVNEKPTMKTITERFKLLIEKYQTNRVSKLIENIKNVLTPFDRPD